MKSEQLKNHKITRAIQHASPHFDERPDESDISLLVIHCISLPEGEYGTPYVKDLFMGELQSNAHPDFAPLDGLRVSAHCVIRRDGTLEQYVPFDKRAWHAGQSRYCGRKRCNDFSIGIELEGTDQSAYTDKQYQCLVEVTELLLMHYPKLNRRRIIGHEHIAPGRKTDPGSGFDWPRYLNQL
ncbi:1,6-anhydro-N-acetylmuramyl-L-alanine amidase AmpD [Idiomarina sp.]|uniref:1,6-anhydro-N-acetylmuramyl-L-alanine amidase AmpD n=1 Tax=Idiomarina sp. TaxID=1874361 RepID=UPI0023567C85|nr:1,6-anhydro-N-acetylmuramyl-L-alanine amidase AmpD [Idiomarina sp.]MCH2454127.1 1,6-anhydro-N-acetylmuramyl-L-alanine amidase AmpD [Idiomarina sp.]MCJ8316652.1 1,6-anhydro-N-acetylmuramyl-L-alanine amidase AmpD [Idiomarina sp.]